MKRDLHVVIERDEEGGLVGSVPALPGCHTQGRSLDELMERVHEALAAYIEVRGAVRIQKGRHDGERNSGYGVERGGA